MGPDVDIDQPLRAVVPPFDLKAFPDARRVRPKTPRMGGGLRARWKASDGKIYEWDYQHGTVEVYDRHGNHTGECDPQTGQSTKGPVRNRRIEP